MIRTLSIVVLSLGILMFGMWTVGILVVGITHRHLSMKGLMMLWFNGYVTWTAYKYLRETIAERKQQLLLYSDNADVEYTHGKVLIPNE